MLFKKTNNQKNTKATENIIGSGLSYEQDRELMYKRSNRIAWTVAGVSVALIPILVFGGFNRKVDKCAQEEENNYQGLAQNQEQDLQNAVAQYQNAIDEAKITQTETVQETEQQQPKNTSQAGWGDGSEAITGGAGLVGDHTCVHWAGSRRLAPSAKYKISFSRLGSSTREISEFTTSQGGEFSLCLADSAFDPNKEITLTDESGNVVYVKNKKSNSIDSRSVTETKLGRFYQLHNTPISDEDKLREDQSGTYWIH